MSEIKYKLLKELPFCKVGDIGVIKNNNGINLLKFTYNNNNDYYVYDIQEIQTLIEQGWIEEYKPKTQEEIFRDLISFYAMLQLVKIDRTEETIIDSMIKKYEIKEKE